MAGAEGRLLGRAAAGRRPVRAGRGAGPHRRDRGRSRRCCTQAAAASPPRPPGAPASSSRVASTSSTTCRPAWSPAAPCRQRPRCRPPSRGAVLIGVDLGPNLSVTGSLATILWLVALRREGSHVGAWHFLKLGARGDAAGAACGAGDRDLVDCRVTLPGTSLRTSNRPRPGGPRTNVRCRRFQAASASAFTAVSAILVRDSSVFFSSFSV